MANIIGLFNSRSAAESAVHQLVNYGINRDHISIVARDTKDEDTRNLKTDDDTSGAAKGAGIGAALGGVGGLIAGIAGLAIPGIGPILAAGPIAAAIGGALGGAGLGAAAGGIIGALTDMGVPEDEARHYEDQVRQGKILVTVRATMTMKPIASPILWRSMVLWTLRKEPATTESRNQRPTLRTFRSMKGVTKGGWTAKISEPMIWPRFPLLRSNWSLGREPWKAGACGCMGELARNL